MNFQFYLEKLLASGEFEAFLKENPDAYLCSAFFAIDLENLKKPDNQFHFDYFVPSLKKMFSFQTEEEVSKVPLEGAVALQVPEKILRGCSFDFEEVENLIKDRMKTEKIKNKIQKILLSLQNKDGKDFLIGTIFISSMGLIKIQINLDEMKIGDFEKKSFFDMVNVFKKK